MKRAIFILIPSAQMTGPVKGAVALANALASNRLVTLVTLKAGPDEELVLDGRIRHVELGAISGWRARLGEYKKLLLESGGRDGAASISFCLSADIFNLFSRKNARTCSSIRGNLLRNYRMDYGWIGNLIAVLHLLSMRGHDRVVAMTNPMARQVTYYLGSPPSVIPNFVDEDSLDIYRGGVVGRGRYEFMFLGSLSRRKHPMALLEAMKVLVEKGHDAFLHIVGKGPLEDDIRQYIEKANLTGRVTFHGHLRNPYPLLTRVDAMVLPSFSEGMSRASLEALYLGTPCVLRAVDGNAELIQSGQNGTLFEVDAELPDAMIRAANLCRAKLHREVLLPLQCRQAIASMQYLALLEED